MIRQNLPKSMRKFLRKEKARIRREIFDAEQAEEKIRELVIKTAGEHNKKKVVITTND